MRTVIGVTVPLLKRCRGDAQGLQERVITGFDLVRAEVAAPEVMLELRSEGEEEVIHC